MQSEVIAAFIKWLTALRQSGHRGLIIVTPEFAPTIQAELSISYETLAMDSKSCHINQVIGSENDVVVANIDNNLNPNRLAAWAGTIRSGGVLLLCNNISSPITSRFVDRFIETLKRCTALFFVDHTGQISTRIPEKFQVSSTINEQPAAIEKICHVLEGHRKRPLVILGDRGRGKSAVMGIAAAKLASQKDITIGVCASRKSNTDVLFKHFNDELSEKHIDRSIMFFPTDALLDTRPDLNILFIDEAASIPQPVLTKILTYYSRVVVASTYQGYEGSGRGFLLMLSRVMQLTGHNHKELFLTQPKRWNEGDALEAAINHAFLFKTQPEQTLPHSTQMTCKTISQDDLRANESLLNQVYGLLFLAHYRTSPDDLKLLLDQPSLVIHLGQIENTVIAVCLINYEGGLTEADADAIYNGDRRFKGHLLPQMLSFQMNIAAAPRWNCARVLRIAVNPALQGKGFGKTLLKHAEHAAIAHGASLIGASFGAHSQILGFWQQNGMRLLRIGHHQEKTSGLYPALVVKPLGAEALKEVELSQQCFYKELSILFRTSLNSVSADLLVACSSFIKIKKDLNLSPQSKHRLKQYSEGKRTFEIVRPALEELAQEICEKGILKSITVESHAFILRVIQYNSWEYTSDTLNLSGRKAIEQYLRAFLATII